MIRNDINAEVEELIKSGHWTRTDITSRMGVTRQYYNKIMNRPHLDQKFVDMLDVMGYDIEVKFVRKRR